MSVGDQKQRFHALTIIDMVTNLVEVVRVDNTTAANVASILKTLGLLGTRNLCIASMTQEASFSDMIFSSCWTVMAFKPGPPLRKIHKLFERMHQAIGHSLRVLTTLTAPAAGVTTPTQLLDTAMANAMYATCCTYHSALKTTPGGLAFGRDMILNIPLVTDLELLQERRQQLIDQRLITANAKRFSYDYRVGDEVLKLVYKPNKLDPRATGPFVVEQVHANGTLSIRLNPTVVERISLRRVKPYHR
jgi:hypothetical protein